MAGVPPSIYNRTVVGYHGTDRSVVQRVLLTGEPLRASVNPYDWLGEGIYFWEHGPRRALEFAEEQKKRGKVDDPAVIGAYLNLGRCFDLTDRWATELLHDFHQGFVEAMAQAGKDLPRNAKAGPDDHDLLLRHLDCAVLNFGMRLIDTDEGGSGPHYQTVRGVFVEGVPAYEDARIYTKTHVQIAVRDPDCILGYFMPAAYTEE